LALQLRQTIQKRRGSEIILRVMQERNQEPYQEREKTMMCVSRREIFPALGRVHTLIFIVHMEDAAGGVRAISSAFETFKGASVSFNESAERNQRKQWRRNMEDEQESMPSVRGRKSGLGDKQYKDAMPFFSVY
jgi:hypothetical protein